MKHPIAEESGFSRIADLSILPTKDVSSKEVRPVLI
jgi:hypothetical protein